jgi:uncharacterized membrane protein YidH (DUF202 family)
MQDLIARCDLRLNVDGHIFRPDANKSRGESAHFERALASMLHWISTSLDISVPLAIAIVTFGVSQLALQIYALVDLIRRPAATGRKVLFALVIVLSGLLGAIAYLAVGRSMLAEETSEVGNAGTGNVEVRRRAIDQLYGPDDRK